MGLFWEVVIIDIILCATLIAGVALYMTRDKANIRRIEEYHKRNKRP